MVLHDDATLAHAQPKALGALSMEYQLEPCASRYILRCSAGRTLVVSPATFHISHRHPLCYFPCESHHFQSGVTNVILNDCAGYA